METSMWGWWFYWCCRVLTVPMRNGNRKFKQLSQQIFLGSYRTYEEWKHGSVGVHAPIFKSSYRTYEEWKPKVKLETLETLLGSYRTYEEWKRRCQWEYYKHLIVLTVPMRNGNLKKNSPANTGAILVLTVPMRNGNLHTWILLGWSMVVLTVPMRNGNRVKTACTECFLKFLPYLWGMETWLEWWYTCLCFWFLPYLWGMETILRNVIFTEETRSYRTYEEWKLRCKSRMPSPRWVLTVPMRNGNLLSPTPRTSFVIVLTVPMRNGNPVPDDPVINIHSSSYRTYEEWKLSSTWYLIKSLVRSYRTYEEWKHAKTIKSIADALQFLPYLWGMETRYYQKCFEYRQNVLTVPMRNGNMMTIYVNVLEI